MPYMGSYGFLTLTLLFQFRIYIYIHIYTEPRGGSLPDILANPWKLGSKYTGNWKIRAAHLVARHPPVILKVRISEWGVKETPLDV